MKLPTFLLLLSIAGITSSSTCNKTTTSATSNNCFKGRLEIKGICLNYVIKVTEGDVTKLNIERTWTDEQTGKTHQNVFGLSNPCSFPDLKEGEAFYFTIEANTDNDCMRCEAYRPTPKIKNNIAVIKGRCK